MSDWQNLPHSATSFYHVSRQPELVVTKDRDVLAFVADAALLEANNVDPAMEIWRDEDEDFLQWATSGAAPGSGDAVLQSERILMWGRVSGDELASGFRWVPYIDSRDPDNTTIRPLREVFAPRVVFDRTSNTLHLWFWTNVNFDYMGNEYDEAELYPVGMDNYTSVTGNIADPQAKRVLCYSSGFLGHYYVKGGYLNQQQGDEPFIGMAGYGYGYTFKEDQYDLVPVFTRPQIVTNYPYSNASGTTVGTSPGMVTDGWYEGGGDPMPFELIDDPLKEDGYSAIRCGQWTRNGVDAVAPYNSDDEGTPAGPGFDKDLTNIYRWSTVGLTGDWYIVVYRLTSETFGSASMPDGWPWLGYTAPVWPPAVQYAATQDFNTFVVLSGAPQTDYSNPAETFTNTAGPRRFHNWITLGKINIDALTPNKVTILEQDWQGGFIKDQATVPDSQAALYDSTDARRTLEFNPATPGHHDRELQMRHVNLIPERKGAVPIALVEEPDSSYPRVDMTWAAIDGLSPWFNRSGVDPPRSSLHVTPDMWDTKRPYAGDLEVHGFAAATATGGSARWAPYMADVQASGRKVINWHAPVSVGGTAAGSEKTNATFPTTPYGAGTTTWNDTVPNPSLISGLTGSGGYDVTVGFSMQGHKVNVVNGALVIDNAETTIASGNMGGYYTGTFPDTPSDHIIHELLNFSNWHHGPGIAGQNWDHDERYIIQGDDGSASAYVQSLAYGATPGLTPDSSNPLIQLSPYGGILQRGDDGLPVVNWDTQDIYTNGSDYWHLQKGSAPLSARLWIDYYGPSSMFIDPYAAGSSASRGALAIDGPFTWLGSPAGYSAESYLELTPNSDTATGWYGILGGHGNWANLDVILGNGGPPGNKEGVFIDGGFYKMGLFQNADGKMVRGYDGAQDYFELFYDGKASFDWDIYCNGSNIYLNNNPGAAAGMQNTSGAFINWDGTDFSMNTPGANKAWLYDNGGESIWAVDNRFEAAGVPGIDWTGAIATITNITVTGGLITSIT